MDSRTLPEEALELGRIRCDDLRRVELAAEALLQLERPQERRRHRHLLVEREPDEERERILRDELVRLVRVGEVERLGHELIVTASAYVGASRMEGGDSMTCTS